MNEHRVAGLYYGPRVAICFLNPTKNYLGNKYSVTIVDKFKYKYLKLVQLKYKYQVQQV